MPAHGRVSYNTYQLQNDECEHNSRCNNTNDYGYQNPNVRLPGLIAIFNRHVFNSFGSMKLHVYSLKERDRVKRKETIINKTCNVYLETSHSYVYLKPYNVYCYQKLGVETY